MKPHENDEKTLWHGRCITVGAMSNNTHESTSIAFLEALAGEYTGATSAYRSWQRPSRDPSQELIAAFASEVRALVA